MPRYRRQDDYYESESPSRRRFSRKKGVPVGLLIALGGAGIAGLVFILIMAGSSGGEQEIEEATKMMQDLFRSCIENNQGVGAQLVDPRGVLADQDKNALKKWAVLTPEQKAELYVAAWQWVRQNVTADLQVTDMAKANSYLMSAKAVYEHVPDSVSFSWDVLGRTWHAKVSHRTGRWLLMKFGRA